MKYKKPSNKDKYNYVVKNNTFFYSNCEFEEKYEGYINSLCQILLSLKNDIANQGHKKEIFEKLIKEKEHGLRAVLALCGLSNELFKRIITIIRVAKDKELDNLTYTDKWDISDEKEELNEWTDNQISNLIKDNDFFVKGIVNLLFYGATVPFLTRTLPLFELKKLNIAKLKFEVHELIDTLVRYKEKGSYSGKLENNPEMRIREILEELRIDYQQGDLPKLSENENSIKRTMDFIIPNNQAPLVIIECSFLSTTSSGQGDKSKVEISMRSLIRQYYPKAKFIGFVDGIGWLVRKRDLRRMVEAYEDVFTFHKDDIKRFKKFMRRVS